MIDPDPTIQTLPPEDTPSVPPTTILVKLPTAQDDEARAREAVTDERTHARIGILFVHGMGDQQRGSSLQRFGDPIVQWLRRWQSYDFDRQLMTISEQAPASIKSGIEPTEESVSTIPTSSPLGYTVIKGQGADPASFEPPNSELTLLRASRKPGQPTSASWIMTEAWWADAFFPPKFSDVAKWGLGVGPRFVVRHFELPSSGLARLPQAIRYGIALISVLLFELVIMLLLTLAAIPFARNYVKGLILKLIGSFGDPMVLIASPLTSAAISTAVNNAITWLKETRGCDQIAIVAHSLGTVVSYDILSRNSERVGLFVTFGAALKKAQILQKVQQNDVRLSLGIVLASSGFVAFALMTWISILFWSELGRPLTSISAIGEFLRWTWPHLLLTAGSLLCIARLALWRTKGPRFVAPLGCLLALAGGVIIVSLSPSPSDPISLSDIEFDFVMDGLSFTDILQLVPIAIAGVLVTIREVQERTAILAANPVGIQALQTRTHPWHIGSPLIQSLLVVGGFLVCVEAWDPPQFLTPLVITGFVLCFSAIRVPFGSGYIDEQGMTFPFANDASTSTLKWRDYWASADPVPDGGFANDNISTSPRPVDLVSTATANQRSVASDHSIYEENLEQFVGPLVSELVELSGWDELFAETNDLPVVGESKRRRVLRVKVLPHAALVLAASAVAIVVYLYIKDQIALSELGNKALTPLLGVFKLVLDDNWVDRINALLPGTVFGALLILFVAVLWYRVAVFQAWRQWDKADQSAMFRRYAVSIDTAVRYRKWIFAVVGFVAPLAAVAVVVYLSVNDISWWPES